MSEIEVAHVHRSGSVQTGSRSCWVGLRGEVLAVAMHPSAFAASQATDRAPSLSLRPGVPPAHVILQESLEDRLIEIAQTMILSRRANRRDRRAGVNPAVECSVYFSHPLSRELGSRMTARATNSTAPTMPGKRSPPSRRTRHRLPPDIGHFIARAQS
jgi:hypothetical protein